MQIQHVSTGDLRRIRSGKTARKCKAIPGSKRSYRLRECKTLVRYFICNDCSKEDRVYGAGGLPLRCNECAGARTGTLVGVRYMMKREDRQKAFKGKK